MVFKKETKISASQNSSSATADKKTAKRNKIADMAFDLFLKNGYINTKIIDIAEKAGIGKGTLYEYFPGKEALLIYLIETKILPEFAELEVLVAKESGAVNKLMCYIDFEHRFICKFGVYCNDIKMQFIESDVASSEKIIRAILQIHAMERDIVRSIVKDGIEAGEIREFDADILTNCICATVSSALTACNLDKAMADGNIVLACQPESIKKDILSFIMSGAGA